MRKTALKLFFLCLPWIVVAQKNPAVKTLKKNPHAQTHQLKVNPDPAIVKSDVAALIPQKLNGKYGFIDQSGKLIIPHEYSNVGFFAEDCNLLNSPIQKVRRFGSNRYASVRLNGKDFRINQAGKRVYLFKNSDLGKCPHEFKRQLFHAYVMNNRYGIIEDAKFENPGDYRQFTIYPQYDYLHIMEGDDLKNPMIIAARDDKFGVIDLQNRVVVPFIYSDIKRNFSWKLARLFEVTKDGVSYFYVDDNNKAY